MESTTIWDRQTELSKELKELPADKDRVKLLLKTIDNCNDEDDIHGEMIAFSVSYLGSLLAKHGLNDFK